MMTITHLYMFLSVVVLVCGQEATGSTPPVQTAASGCECTNRDLDLSTALADQNKDSLCKFGSLIHECLMKCEPDTAKMLNVALMKNPCVSCGGVRIITSLLCVLLPVLHPLL